MKPKVEHLFLASVPRKKKGEKLTFVLRKTGRCNSYWNTQILQMRSLIWLLLTVPFTSLLIYAFITF